MSQMPVKYHVTNLMNKSKSPSDSLLFSRKVCTEKDPRPTRHRGVLTLKVPIDVYDMLHSKSSNFAEVVAGCRGAKPIFQASKIATKRYLKRTDLPGFADVSILIYSTSSFTNKHLIRKSQQSQQLFQRAICLVITIPTEWTPQLFLAILNKSISDHGVLSLETINLQDGKSLSCLNNVHCYFRCEIQSLKIALLEKGTYGGVFGGDSI